MRAGSHKRWRSEEEYEAMSHYKGGGVGPKFGLTKYSDLPNMHPVALKAGQTIFWGEPMHGVDRPLHYYAVGP